MGEKGVPVFRECNSCLDPSRNRNVTNKSEPNLVRKQLLIMRDKVSKFFLFFIFLKGTGPLVIVTKNRASPFFPFFKTRTPRGRI